MTETEQRQAKTAARLVELTEMLETFGKSGISHDPKRGGLKQVVRFQDLCAWLSVDELRPWEAALNDAQRRLWVWALVSCLDCETATGLYVKTVGRRKIMLAYESERGDLAEWEKRLADEEGRQHIAMETCKAEVRQAERNAEQAAAREAQMKAESDAKVAELQEAIAGLRAELAELEGEAHAIRTELGHLQGVKAAVRALVGVELR
jgi:hypothetical protein